MSEKSTYSIRELEELSGIPAHTLRTWERRYGILKPVRDKDNARCYAKEVLGYLRDLGILLRKGYRISALASKSREQVESLAKEHSQTLPDDLTAALGLALQDFEHTRLEHLMTSYIRKDGFDTALSERFIPFLDQMSVLLLSGVLKPIHVQIFCGALRQKIFARMETLEIPKKSERWLLVHGKPEIDTVHRDVVHYLMKRGGMQVIRLDMSAQTTLSELCLQLKPAGCCLIADEAYSATKLIEMIRQSMSVQGNTLVFSPGKTLDFINNEGFSDIIVIKGLPDAFQYWIVA